MPAQTHELSHRLRAARLYLNGIDVGAVKCLGIDDSWSFGEFAPSPAFSTFAPLFGTWSLLMHYDEEATRLSEAASEELRDAEYAIDALRALVLFADSGERLSVRQLNIDGSLIEWKA